MKKVTNIIPIIMLTVLLALAGCGKEDDTQQREQPVAFTISEQPWQDEQFDITTRGTTENDLKANGFGLYCSDLGMANVQVTWQSGKWDYGYTAVWHSPKSDENTFSVYAYAPYGCVDSWNATDGTVNFTASKVDNETDLLWACDEEVKRHTGATSLDFHHALARLSFGTITNKTGYDIQLTGVTIKGELYRSGTLSLATGTWSEQTNYTDGSGDGGHVKTIDRTEDTDAKAEGDQPLTIENGKTKGFGLAPLTLIPDPAVSLTFKFGKYKGFTVGNFTVEGITLEQATDLRINVTVDENFRVVIE